MATHASSHVLQAVSTFVGGPPAPRCSHRTDGTGRSMYAHTINFYKQQDTQRFVVQIRGGREDREVSRTQDTRSPNVHLTTTLKLIERNSRCDDGAIHGIENDGVSGDPDQIVDGATVAFPRNKVGAASVHVSWKLADLSRRRIVKLMVITSPRWSFGSSRSTGATAPAPPRLVPCTTSNGT